MGHTLVLVRHGQQLDAEHGVADSHLSDRGVRQSQLLGERLRLASPTRIWHSPFDRAADTAAILSTLMPDVAVEATPLLIDCVPSGPSPEMPSVYNAFFKSVTNAEIEAGRAQMFDAVSEFLAPGVRGQTDVLVTHNSVVAWFVREVLDAPDWRWLTLGQHHCGITVVHQKAGRSWSLVTHNDVAHLPADLRTGLTEPVAW